MHEGDAPRAAPVTWLVAAIGAAACAAGAQIGADARWLAALGRIVARSGEIPAAVTYAAAPSYWHDAPVLGQLGFYALEASFGDAGLLVAQLAAVALALAFVALDLRRARVRDGAGALVLVALLAAAPAAFLVVRAELFSLALFPLLLLLLRRETDRPSRRIWLAVPLLALWANLHGGVLMGFGVLAAYLLLERLRHARVEAPLVLVASTLALFATPAGLHSASYYAGVLRGEAVVEHYGMWAPLSLHAPLDVLFLAVVIPLLACALRGRPAPWEAAVLLGFAVLSLEARRDGIWLALVALTPAARSFGRAAGARLVSRPVALACFALPALIVVTGFSRPAPQPGAGRVLLARAAVEAHGTPILATPLLAEQLALAGDRIWIGNPLDAFARGDQRRYLRWLRGDPGADNLVGIPVRIVLAARGSAAQVRLAHRRGVREIARDGSAVLYRDAS